MEKWKQHRFAFALTLSLTTGLLTGAQTTVSGEILNDAVQDTAGYMYRTVQDPQVGSIDDEWAVLGLAQNGHDVPDSYYQDYYTTVEAYAKACGDKLHDKKYTEHPRVIVALSLIGKDARNVGGYDLTKPLGNYGKTIWQGLNGPIWALTTLDPRDCPMPENPGTETQATRQIYIDRILEYRLPDGGWNLFRGTSAVSSGDGISDPDITGIALQALARYQGQPAMARATEEALACMSKKQNSEGGFSSWRTRNSKNCAQIIVVLCELGIPLDDPRFVKNGNTLLDNLMASYPSGNGFLHMADGSSSNQMASGQVFYDPITAQRLQDGRNSLYRMSNARTIPDGPAAGPAKGAGLERKDPAVHSSLITQTGKTFDDITGVNAHENQSAIEALAARGIINDKSDGSFDSGGSMTRTGLAAIMVRALGLTPEGGNSFSDVAAEAWYVPYVGAAYSCGIITGVGDGRFNPSGTITRQKAAVMVPRTTKLCGPETEMNNAATRNMLARFPDYMNAAEQTHTPLAFCYQEKILDQAELSIRSLEAVIRVEVAQMLLNLLSSTNLL